MSWQGWHTRGPSLKREPTPEPAPPAFHKQSTKKRKKPWSIEVRMLRMRRWPPDPDFPPAMGEWQTLARYATEEARDQALAKAMRVNHREGRVEYRPGA